VQDITCSGVKDKWILDRVDAILQHPIFAEKLNRTIDLERDRVFCGHGMDHLLDVARITYILYLESNHASLSAISEQAEKRGFRNSNLAKEQVYAAAFLHDIGRARQYEDGTPHEIESAALATPILVDCGFDASECALIIDAILSHRAEGAVPETWLATLLQRADKLSRHCTDCAASNECKWELKNGQLGY